LLLSGDGDPSQDVAVASVLFLVDGKLVLLQPSVSETGDLKYDMRVVAQDVEYYILMRDQLSFNFAPPSDDPSPEAPPPGDAPSDASQLDASLRDSLWVFCGKDLLFWSDVQDLLHQKGSPSEISKPLPIPVDFYPLSILLNKGIILGIESEMSQRRDVTFTLLKFAIRVSLSNPYLFTLLWIVYLISRTDSIIPTIRPPAQSVAIRLGRGAIHLPAFLPFIVSSSRLGDPPPSRLG
jgi:hypothetical protein